MGEELVEQQMDVLPEGAKPNAKTLALLGEATATGETKAIKVLGDSGMDEVQIRALRAEIEREEKQRAKDADEAMRKALAEGASEDQVKVIARRESLNIRRVRNKALDMMGEELIDQEKTLLAEGTQANAKTLKLLGEVQSTGNQKLEKLLGSDMTDEQLKMLKEAAIREEEELYMKEEAERVALLKQKEATQDQKFVKGTHQQSAKVLNMLGDEELNKEQQKLLSKDAKANKKTMQLLGDVGASSGNKKIAQLMGDDMSDDDLRKMLEKDNLDVAEKARLRRISLDRKIKLPPSLAQKHNFDRSNVKEGSKALKVVGEDVFDNGSMKQGKAGLMSGMKHALGMD